MSSEMTNISDKCENDNRVIKELTIPVPWGAIAVKTWGDPCASPVLLVHGIQDNCGTFDRLIPYLPNGFYYVGVDLPGHGFSSRFSKGYRIDFMQYILSLNRVVRQLQWGLFTFIGHSLGGQLGQYYAAMFPEQVAKLIVLDAYGPISVPTSDYLAYNRKLHEEVIALENKIMNAEPPSYTYEVALQKVVDNRRSYITKEAAEKLVPRNLKKGKNGYYFSPDQRLKLHVLLPLSFKQHFINYEKISCPFLLVLTKGMYEFLGIDHPENVQNTLIGAFTKNPKFKLVTVEGAHDVHNISPEIIGPIVKSFMLKQKSSL